MKAETEQDAWKDLTEFLDPGERIGAIVFGNWGWSFAEEPESGAYGEPDPPLVPVDMRSIILDPEEARPFMKGWSFKGGYGAPTCYAMYAWTPERVIWVSQYDGKTWLSSAPRFAEHGMPRMVGGG